MARLTRKVDVVGVPESIAVANSLIDKEIQYLGKINILQC
jgi:hypothetical protein